MTNKTRFIAALIILVVLILACGNQGTNTSTKETKQTETIKKQTPVKLEGSGDKVKTITLNKGVAIFTMDHSGNRNFSVVIKGSNGEYLDLLANDIGNYNGQKTFTVTKDGTYLIEITASGKWTIDIE